MLDAVNISYGAAPIRMYIVQKGQVVYEGGAGPMGYRLDHVREWLDNNFNSLPRKQKDSV